MKKTPISLLLIFLLFFLNNIYLCVEGETIVAAPVRYSLGNLITIELRPETSYNPSDCVLGNCTSDSVTNIFFGDLVQGAGPCFIADNLYQRELDDLIQILDDEGKDTLDFSVAALFDHIFNDEDCDKTLSLLFNDLGCSIESEYNIEDFQPILIRIVEAGKGADFTDNAALDTGCVPPAGECKDKTRRIVLNFIIPSFCGSTCVFRQTCFTGLPEPVGKNLDWLLYRYELQQARAQIHSLVAKLRTTEYDVDAVVDSPTPSLGVYDAETRNFQYNCLPDWEETLLDDLQLPSPSPLPDLLC